MREKQKGAWLASYFVLWKRMCGGGEKSEVVGLNLALPREGGVIPPAIALQSDAVSFAWFTNKTN
jgi:hypothetical protein